MARHHAFDMNEVNESGQESDGFLLRDGVDDDRFDEYEEEYRQSEADYDDDLPEEAHDHGERDFEGFVRDFEILVAQEFESSIDFDQELDGILSEMQRTYFEAPLLRDYERGKRRGLFGKIASGAAKLVGGAVSKVIPFGGLLKAGTDLVSGIAKDGLKNVGRRVLDSVAPGLSDIAEGAGDLVGRARRRRRKRRRGRAREARQFAEMSRTAFEHLAHNLTADAYEPFIANELATDALREAMQAHGLGGGRRRSGRNRSITLADGITLVIRQ